jgi:hypothetical protein
MVGNRPAALVALGLGIVALAASVARRRVRSRPALLRQSTAVRPTRFSHALLAAFKEICTDFRVERMFERVLATVYRLLPVEVRAAGPGARHPARRASGAPRRRRHPTRRHHPAPPQHTARRTRSSAAAARPHPVRSARPSSSWTTTRVCCA